MLIIYFIIAVLLCGMVSYMITKVICKVKTERNNMAFANLPKEVLLQYALIDPVCSASYQRARMVMNEDVAAENAINYMLINNGLIGYRKRES